MTEPFGMVGGAPQSTSAHSACAPSHEPLGKQTRVGPPFKVRPTSQENVAMVPAARELSDSRIAPPTGLASGGHELDASDASDELLLLPSRGPRSVVLRSLPISPFTP